MKARPYRQSDILSLDKWLRRRGCPGTNSEQLPAIGFIVPGVAAGFIRNCETGVAMLDSYISNPLCSSETRNAALNSITTSLLQQPFKQFITMTADEGLMHRFQSSGFIAAPQYLWLFKEATCLG